MIAGAVEYFSRMQGIEFETVECHAHHALISRIEVSAQNGGDVTFRVHLSGVTRVDEAVAIASSEVSRVVDLLSVNLGRAVTEPRLANATLTEVGGDSPEVVGLQFLQTLQLTDVATAVRALGPVSLGSLRQALAEASPPGEPNYVLFRNALAATDPASKFLGLYQILALLNGDDQDAIDAFIVAKEPGVQWFKTKPRRNGTFKDETIYTRLRNEHSHHRPGVSLATTRKEMVANLSGLVVIVQSAVKRP